MVLPAIVQFPRKGVHMKTSGRILTTVVMLAGATVPVAPILAQVMAPNADYHRFIKSQRSIESETSVDAAADSVTALAAEPRSGGPFREAPAAFDNRTNGFDTQGPAFDLIDEDNVVPLRSFNDNRFIFEEVETVDDGLGPTFNAQACRECHQNIVTGGASQVAEHRTGRLELLQFVESIGGSLIQSRSTHPDIFERVPFEDSVGTLRISTNTLGAGFIEAIANDTLAADTQCPACGDPRHGARSGGARGEQRAAHRALRLEEPARAACESFAADAYLNEMGITTPLPAGGEHVAGPQRRIRHRHSIRSRIRRTTESTSSRSRTSCARRRRHRAAPITADVRAGETRCSTRRAATGCHVATLRTAAPGTRINGGALRGARCASATRSSTRTATSCCTTSARATAFPCCRAPSSRRPRARSARRRCGRLRTRNRLMHDGLSFTKQEAITRHAGQATAAKTRVRRADGRATDTGDGIPRFVVTLHRYKAHGRANKRKGRGSRD